MQGLSIESVEVLLLVAAVVAIIVRRLRMPYTVGLVLAGVLLSLAGKAFALPLTKELIFQAFLPPLVFEAAYQIEWPKLRAELGLLSVLTTIGVLIAAMITAEGMSQWASWTWPASILFGILISATDPVSVLALFKELNIQGRLKLLLEAESLLNDGTVAVFFAVAFAAFSAGGAPGAESIVQSFLMIVLGGIICGAAVGAGALLLARRTDEPFVEILITTVAAFGSFLLAEHFGFSGILSTLTAGILIGNLKAKSFTSSGMEALDSFWQFAAFVVNSLVFLLVGITLSRQDFLATWTSAVTAIIVVLVARAVAVYLCCLPFTWSRQRISFREQQVLVWGGLRGALALALALSLPGWMVPVSDLTSAAFAVVAFSIVVQGLTITPLLRKVGEVEVLAR